MWPDPKFPPPLMADFLHRLPPSWTATAAQEMINFDRKLTSRISIVFCSLYQILASKRAEHRRDIPDKPCSLYLNVDASWKAQNQTEFGQILPYSDHRYSIGDTCFAVGYADQGQAPYIESLVNLVCRQGLHERLKADRLCSQASSSQLAAHLGADIIWCFLLWMNSNPHQLTQHSYKQDSKNSNSNSRAEHGDGFGFNPQAREFVPGLTSIVTILSTNTQKSEFQISHPFRIYVSVLSKKQAAMPNPKSCPVKNLEAMFWEIHARSEPRSLSCPKTIYGISSECRNAFGTHRRLQHFMFNTVRSSHRFKSRQTLVKCRSQGTIFKLRICNSRFEVASVSVSALSLGTIHHFLQPDLPL